MKHFLVFPSLLCLTSLLLSCTTKRIEHDAATSSSIPDTTPAGTLAPTWGNEIGNGGGVVLCGGKISLIDFYEARLEGTVIESAPEMSVNDILEGVISRLRDWDPDRADRYSKEAQTFLTNAIFVEDDDPRLVRTHDFGLLPSLPPHCSFQEVVFRRLMVWGTRARYVVRKNLWEKMAALDIAGIILHEIAGKESREAGDEVSERLRGFIGLLFNPNSTQEEYSQAKSKVFSEQRFSGLQKSQILLHLKPGQDFYEYLGFYLSKTLSNFPHWQSSSLPHWVSLNKTTGELVGKAPMLQGRTNFSVQLLLSGIEEISMQIEVVVSEDS